MAAHRFAIHRDESTRLQTPQGVRMAEIPPHIRKMDLLRHMANANGEQNNRALGRQPGRGVVERCVLEVDD